MDINWPQVIVSIILGGIITYLLQKYCQGRARRAEFYLSWTIVSKETDVTSEFIQLQVGARGDIQNVNIRELVDDVLRKALTNEDKDKK